MPIYEYQCEKCKGIEEKIVPIDTEAPTCCGASMFKRPTFPVMVKIKGEGGYPSRRKFLKGSAPNTTSATKPWMSYNPNDTTINPMGEKTQD